MSPSARRWIRRVGAPSTQRPCHGGHVNTRAHPPIEPARDQGPQHQGRVDSFTGPPGRRPPQRDDADAERAGAQTRGHPATAHRGCRRGDGRGRPRPPVSPGARRCAGPRSATPPPAAEDRDGGLNQEPAGARVAGRGDRAPALRLARAALAGHQAEVGLERMRVAEAVGIVDGGEEGGGGDGADAGDGAQARHPGILDGEVFDRGVGVRERPVEGAHEGEQGRDAGSTGSKVRATATSARCSRTSRMSSGRGSCA